MSERTVLVTGATGFIAIHVVDQLLAKGYKVIGTARSEAKYNPLVEQFKEEYPDGQLSYEIVEDIAKDNAFDHVLQNHPEITAVLHTASPFSFGLNKPFEEAYLNPAVNGTVNILKAIRDYAPQVTNVVVTSSFAAVKQLGPELLTYLHTSESWNPIKWEDVKNEGEAYAASKTYAERAARSFIAENSVNFKLATVNPPIVLGPQRFDTAVKGTLNTSNETINSVAAIDNDSTEPLNQFPALAVDVRDVAAFHILPLEVPQLAEQRQFIVAGPSIAQYVVDVLNRNFSELKGKIPVGDPFKEQELIATNTPQYNIDDVIAKAGGYKLIDVETSIVDTYKQYLKYHSV